jgi:hypothetical protein
VREGGQDGSEGMESMELVRSIGSDEEGHPILERFRQIFEEFERPLVGPVKVVDRHHDGRSSCQIRERRGEEAETPIAQVRIGERVGLTLRSPRDIRYAVQRIDEWPERSSRFRFDALPVEDLDTSGSRVRDERGEEPALTDPSIARDEDRPTRTAHSLGEWGIERGERGLAPNECRTKDSLRGRRPI